MRFLVILWMLTGGVLVSQRHFAVGAAARGELLSGSTLSILIIALSGLWLAGSRLAPQRSLPIIPIPLPRIAFSGTATAILLGVIVLVPWSAGAMSLTSLVNSETTVDLSGDDDQRERLEL